MLLIMVILNYLNNIIIIINANVNIQEALLSGCLV